MLRKIYYSLPANWRLFLRKIVFLPHDLIKGKSNTLQPPKRLIYTGGGDFVKIGEDWITFFKQHTLLNEHSNVLDIGSGIGRIAIPLTRFLKGRYEGFDVVKQGVDWCKKNITKRFENFRFTYVDLFNDLYKNKGISAQNFSFPYDDAAFDFACSISVFTHMLPEEVDNYLKESFRVMKTDGYLLATFFILDEESNNLMLKHDGLNFRHSFGNYALLDKKVKSANVAYHRDYLEAMIRQAGFSIQKEVKGHWCGRENKEVIEFQDIIIMQKVTSP